MEFNEKLQQLRKQNNLTQEQLAEQLYVSRTAVSKWESGKGYPNIESLKCISKVFAVSIDELLSGNELITLAQSENRSNISKLYSLMYGILDVMAFAFIFLPFYGQQEGDYIRSVTLLAYSDTIPIIRASYFVILILMGVMGLVELAIQLIVNEKGLRAAKTCSIILQTLAILIFIMTRQPYLTAFLFILLMIKVILLLKGHSKW
ncbi:helix-turn-helix domain-containing protein [Lacrimispora saccharolytica]|uniref:Transcriptional regulator, XRE family n=1 Tax=Lacrimispora saccharolytica (strain ATCC 35040 / DSM 2544 / NRCC 2533 / WM1) TaxID=610130 RepID=D9RAF7_LACSW|nr:helix-turn-helix transcriptional regulator [Lacrimispora saccharolytica]ADL04235.1 transcriptional regulator, XRE family [[Clostridium] saccharolyticum WM1]QRV21484.1 helix-turn-helix transcriptional regulator [Lacrimispora saccharolytica]